MWQLSRFFWLIGIASANTWHKSSNIGSRQTTSFQQLVALKITSRNYCTSVKTVFNNLTSEAVTLTHAENPKGSFLLTFIHVSGDLLHDATGNYLGRNSFVERRWSSLSDLLVFPDLRPLLVLEHCHMHLYWQVLLWHWCFFVVCQHQGVPFLMRWKPV